MTPLARVYSHVLPVWLVWPAVTMTYAATLALLVFFGGPIGDDIVYIDLEVAE